MKRISAKPGQIVRVGLVQVRLDSVWPPCVTLIEAGVELPLELRKPLYSGDGLVIVPTSASITFACTAPPGQVIELIKPPFSS